MRLREEGGKVRGLLEGGRAPVASWPPATNETSSAEGALGQFWALLNTWALLGKK